MGKKVDFLANSKNYYSAVEDVARSQHRRRRRAYNAISVFGWEDLRQELWTKLLERERDGKLLDIFIATIEDFKDYLVSLAEIISWWGRMKLREMEEIPISQLPEAERAYMENLLYSSNTMEEDIM